MKYALLLALCLSCTTVYRPPRYNVQAVQQRVAKREIGWIFDSIPVVRFRPPWVYGMWRLQVESCVGVTKNGWPQLYIAPVSPFGPGYLAAYFRDTDAIVFGLGNEASAAVVRHEFIHWLLAPDTTHNPRYFSTDPTVGQCAQFLIEA